MFNASARVRITFCFHGIAFSPAKLIVFREMAFQSPFSSVKVVVALGKFNS